MKPFRLLPGFFFLFVLISMSTTARAQSVGFDMQFPNYDVLYLSDFVDVIRQDLARNIPDVSFEIRNLAPNPLDIFVTVKATIQLRDDRRPVEMVRAWTDPFTLDGVRRFSSRDFSTATVGDIKFHSSKKSDLSPEARELLDKIQNYVKRFPTAPVGQYTFEIEAFTGTNTSPGQRLGGLSRTITIRNASASEVVVTLVSPEQGATVPTPFPTFSWSSEKPEVVLYVYEKLPIHRSPEEAVTGIPYLKRELRGLSTFTYPADAERRLEIGKAYYWFVETKVFTSRGDLPRRSEIRLFRVLPGGGSMNPLLLALSTMGGDIATQLGNLIQDGWQPSGATIDGSPANVTEVNTLLQRLARENVQVKVSIE